MVVKHRKAQIAFSWEEELYKYITGIVQAKGHKMLAINGMPDHLHIFINFRPLEDLSGLIREIKKSSNHFINKNDLTPERFYWQRGYAVFSYGQSQISRVINYIERQKQHHQKSKTKDEYIELLQRFEIEFKEKHLFNWID